MTKKELKLKQEEAYKNLKMNLQYVLDNFERDYDPLVRENHLMSIGISCRPGVVTSHYGYDPVAEESDNVIKYGTPVAPTQTYKIDSEHIFGPSILPVKKMKQKLISQRKK